MQKACQSNSPVFAAMPGNFPVNVRDKRHRLLQIQHPAGVALLIGRQTRSRHIRGKSQMGPYFAFAYSDAE